jgi:type II secretory pathway component PulM
VSPFLDRLTSRAALLNTDAARRSMIVIGCGLVLLVALLVISHTYRTTQARYRTEQEQLHHWMETNAPALREWRAQHPVSAQPDTGSLLATVSASAQAANLPLLRSAMDTNGAVSVGFGDARFDLLLPWLDELTTRYRLRVESIVITRGSAAGLVDVQMKIR